MSWKLGRLEICTCSCLGETNVSKCSTDMPSHEALYFALMLLQRKISLSKNWQKKNDIKHVHYSLFFYFFIYSSQEVVPPAPLDLKGPWYPKLQIPRANSDAFHTQAWYKDIDPLASVHHTEMKPLVNSYIQKLVQTKWDVAAHGRDLYLVKPTLRPAKKFQHLTRAEEVVITRLRIGHTKATKSHILSQGPPSFICVDQKPWQSLLMQST